MLVQLHNHHTTNYCCVPNFTVELMPLPQSNTDRGHFPLSSRCKRDFFLGPTKPQDLAKSFYMIPTIASSPSLFLHSLDVRNPGPRLISPALGLTRIFFPDLVTSTKSSIHLWQQRTPQTRLGSHTHSIFFNSGRRIKSDPFTRQTGQYTCD